MTEPKSKSKKPRKPRSPSVPSRNLESCVADVKKLYDTYSHGTFAKSEIASLLGVSASSGPFARRVFTLKEFGLIEGSGDSLSVSDIGKQLVKAEAGSTERKKAALEAVRHSSVFAELLDEFKTKLPTADVVANRLESQKNFNAEAAKSTAAVLNDSLTYAGVLDASNNILPVRADEPDNGGGDAGGSGEDSDTPANEAPGNLRVQVPLSVERTVSISYPPDLTEAEAKKVGRVLEAISG